MSMSMTMREFVEWQISTMDGDTEAVIAQLDLTAEASEDGESMLALWFVLGYLLQHLQRVRGAEPRVVGRLLLTDCTKAETVDEARNRILGDLYTMQRGQIIAAGLTLRHGRDMFVGPPAWQGRGGLGS